MRSLSKIIIPIIAFGVLTSSCESEFERYNKENKEVYEDAAQFLMERGKINRKDSSFLYELKIDSTKKIAAFLFKNSELVVYLHETYYTPNLSINSKILEREEFKDKGLDGIDQRRWVSIYENGYGFDYENHIRDASIVARRYTETLKLIMHQEKYKNY